MGLADRLDLGISYSQEDHEFRSGLREYLAGHHPGNAPREHADRISWHRRFAAQLADDGFAAPSWPKEWGGMDLPLSQQLVYHEEFAIAGLRPHPDPHAWMVGPALIRYGTQAQKERFLRRMLRADDLWAQGFSEPEAGSDLPSLRTRARRDGDVYRVTGQKVWTTRGWFSDWIFCLVRTGTQESREKGISYLLIDLTSPGVLVRPLRDMTGGKHFAEVFFDDVEVPVDQRVGEEDQGWKLARTSLGHERVTAFASQAIRYRRVIAELISLAQENGSWEEYSIRQDLAELEMSVRVLAFTGTRVLASVTRNEDPGPAASINRLYYSLFEQRVHEVAMRVIGSNGLLAQDDPGAVQGGRWVWGYLTTRASTIGSGTSEIHRNTISERVLGLPREPAFPAEATRAPQG
jgi:alkylation response protein AidB-like acyl-CoA dehydrogenase